jgi:stage V sporulation protein S
VPDIGPDAVCVKVTRHSARLPAAAVDAANQLRVTGTTKPGAVAGAIAGKARDGTALMSVTCIGPAAVLRATKGLALAMDYVASSGMTLTAAPHFVDLKVADEDRTGVTFDITVARRA